MLSKRILMSSVVGRHFISIARNASLSTTEKQNNSSELTKVVVDPQTKIATLTLNRLPANALTAAFMTNIKESVEDLERQNVLGIILTSSSERIFSAGLDLNEAYNRDVDHLTRLWLSLQNMWKALFSTKLPTAALINGHAVAGGLVLALCCDFRVILPNLTIGLNETQAGIAVPSYVMDSYANVVISRRIAEADMIMGRCYKSDGALNVGLVDAVVDTKEQAFTKCVDFLRTYQGPTRFASGQMKLMFRSKIIENFEKNRDEDLKIFLNGIQRPDVQEFLGTYLQSLKDKGSRK